jgi:hypothetical protein
MKTLNFLRTALVAVTVSGTFAFAQDNAAANPSAPAMPEHIVYLARLPAAADLIKSAGAQGVTISRIDQTSDRLVVTYQYASGRTSTFAYQLLSSAGGSAEPIGTVASSAPGGPDRVVYATAAPTTTVIYADPAPVYYSGVYYNDYNPAWDVFAPLAVGFGIGWASHGGFWHGHGWGGGGWHGGGRVGWHH